MSKTRAKAKMVRATRKGMRRRKLTHEEYRARRASLASVTMKRRHRAKKPPQHARGILPDRIRIDVRTVKKSRTSSGADLCTIVYEEIFKKVPEKAVAVSVDAIRQLCDGRLKVTIRRGPRGAHTVRLRGRIERHVVGDMLTGEFLCWSSMTDLNLRDVILAGVMFNAHLRKQQEAQAAQKPRRSRRRR